MFKKSLLCICFVLTVGLFAHAGEKIRATSFRGRRLYWQTQNTVLDTMNYNKLEKRVKAKIRIRLKHPSAVSIAILLEKGYEVWTLSQWYCTPQEKILLESRRPEVELPDGYRKQIVVSDYYWEPVQKTDIKKAGSKDDDFSVRVVYTGYGYTEFKGREDVIKSLNPVSGLSDNMTLKFNNIRTDEQFSTPYTIYRKYRDILVLSDKAKKDIVADIESMMDMLKLDFSYKTPALEVLK